MNSDTEYTRLLVFPKWENVRLDVFLAGTTQMSRRGARRAISDGLLRRNGETLKVQSRTLEIGDVVDVLKSSLELGVPSRPRIEPPDVLFEDHWLLVASKPAGVLSQPSERQGANELAFDQQVLMHLGLREGCRPYIRLFHRLDRLASGAVLFARDNEALQPLTRAWTTGAAERRYLAIVEGKLKIEKTVIDRPIGRNRDKAWKFQVSENGKPSRTEVEVLKHFGDRFSLIQCRLITGRTHQIRVHLSDFGYPIVGDRLYGSKLSGPVQRPLLHAASLALPHPMTGDFLHIESPLPEDMKGFFQGKAC